MSDSFSSHLEWTGSAEASRDLATFSRDLAVSVGDTAIPMTSAPRFRGNPTRVNPEQLYVAALSACQTLTFLAHAARAGIHVASYTDDARGTLEMSAGKMRMTHVVLHPCIVIRDAANIERARQLVDRAHDDCFIGNSVTAVVDVEPVVSAAAVAA